TALCTTVVQIAAGEFVVVVGSNAVFFASVFRLLCLHQIYQFAAVWFNQRRLLRGGGSWFVMVTPSPLTV
ncbi:hypothetical protein A2U01_0076720, partial [Trifolium medium]|nr:hypothetical protein [Trifolium medium]